MTKSSKGKFFLLALIILIFLPISTQTQESLQPNIGEAAPSFELRSLQGERVTLSSLKGDFVVIHFAASW